MHQQLISPPQRNMASPSVGPFHIFWNVLLLYYYTCGMWTDHSKYWPKDDKWPHSGHSQSHEWVSFPCKHARWCAVRLQAVDTDVSVSNSNLKRLLTARQHCWLVIDLHAPTVMLWWQFDFDSTAIRLLIKGH